MGYVRHHAIVVTSSNAGIIQRAHVKALELGCQVSPLVSSAINGYHSFLIAPDGSKEGWDLSDDGDKRRKAFKDWTRTVRHEDGTHSLEWVEVYFGSDDFDANVVDSEWSY